MQYVSGLIALYTIGFLASYPAWIVVTKLTQEATPELVPRGMIHYMAKMSAARWPVFTYHMFRAAIGWPAHGDKKIREAPVSRGEW